MTDDEVDDPVAAFRARLLQLYAAVGRPPYRQLRDDAALAGFKLAISTAQDLLTSTSTPRWTTIEAFVTACAMHARAHRPEVRVPDTMLDLDAWCRAYEQMESALDEIGRPTHRTSASSGKAAARLSRRSIVPAQLPADVFAFTGREQELTDLERLVSAPADRTDAASQAGGESTAVVISAVSGTAGVGKTALAVHWAHRVAVRFPDGQLYVNLRGFDPGGSPKDPAEAIRGFLDALAVPPQRIPVGLDAQSALYRSLLSNRRMLVMLDNARDAEQARPLLPGTPTCLVLVTSRNQLASLITAGAHLLTLDLLSVPEARELLSRRLGHDRVGAEPRAVEEIITHCARLPLALTIVAARAATHPRFPLQVLADELRDTRTRLDALSQVDTTIDIRAVFSWSYNTLTDDAARLFRLLGSQPGPDISTAAAASLAGLPPPQARPLLAELARAHLVVEHTPGRYTFHDLLRAYAADIARTTDPDGPRQAAIHRLLDHYLATAYAADRILNPTREPITTPPHQPGVSPEHLTDPGQALAWFTTEHAVLLAATCHAAETGFDTHAWQLPWALTTFLDRQGHWLDLATAQHTALDATRRLADLPGQARTHRYLARAYTLLGRNHDADTHYRDALDLYGQSGDHGGQVPIHLNLALVAERQGRYADALEHSRRALELSRIARTKVGQANALNAIGWYQTLLGDHRQAIEDCQQALALLQEIGDLHGEATTWDSLGYAHHHLGRYQEAVTCYQHAIDLYRNVGDRYEEAATLTRLGETHHATNDPLAAHETWQRALDILDELDHPDADHLRARLDH